MEGHPSDECRRTDGRHRAEGSRPAEGPRSTDGRHPAEGPHSTETRRPGEGRRPAEKRVLRELVRTREHAAIAGRVDDSRRLLGTLVSLTFDPDQEVAWRAVEAVGVAIARVAETDPDAAREQMRRLFWLITEESGGICWRAPESLAEALARCPDAFPEYISIVAHLLLELAEEDLDHFRPGVLWAIGRMGTLVDEACEDVLPAVVAALDHPDGQVRGMAAWCLGRIGRADVAREWAGRPGRAGAGELADDGAPVTLFEEGELRRTTVGEIWRAVVGESCGGGCG